MQEKGFWDAMKWMLFDNKGGVSLTLEGNSHPKPADFEAAFPCHTPDFSAQEAAPGDPASPTQSYLTLQHLVV